MGDQFVQGVMPMADKAMANEIAISANPLRMAQFSYNLVTSIVADIIPLAIRATKDSRDKEAIREILAVFNNKLYQARDAYYGAITLGMIQVLIFTCVYTDKKYTFVPIIMINEFHVHWIVSRTNYGRHSNTLVALRLHITGLFVIIF